MAGFKLASMYSKISLLIVTINSLFFIIGLGSSYWQVGESGGQTTGYGLWSLCVEHNNTFSCYTYQGIGGQDSSYDDNLTAARGLVAIAFLFMCACAVLNFFYIYTSALNKKPVAIIITVMAVGCVATNLTGTIIYGSKLVLPNFALSWSIAINIVALIFSVPVACLFVVEVISSKEKDLLAKD